MCFKEVYIRTQSGLLTVAADPFVCFQGMEEILCCFVKEDQPDMNRQIEFIVKQLNSSKYQLMLLMCY